MAGAAGGADSLDLLDHIHALGHLAEYGVAPALGGLGGVVEEAVVSHVDEELGAGRVRVHGAGHGDGADGVADAVLASFLIGARVSFWIMPGSNPPPWIMKLLITRWKMVLS